MRENLSVRAVLSDKSFSALQKKIEIKKTERKIIMKKIFALLFLSISAVTFAADYTFPGWKCTDEAKLAEAYTAADKYQKIPVVILQNLAKTPPNTYAELCAIVDKAVDASEITTKDYHKILYKKQFPYCRNEFVVEAWEYCKKNPSSYDFYYVAYKAKQLNFTDLQVYAYMRDYLLQNSPNATLARQAIDALLNAAVMVDGTDGINVKSDLQRLNRKFSKNLLDNKAAWEPVIAKLRTTLETY